jgi:DNA-binding NtrC family response regulator
MPILAREGMTTALIGKYGERSTKARVALLSRQSATGLASVFTRGGHEFIECADQAALAAAAATAPFDLILCDDESAVEAGHDFGCPMLFVGERQLESGHSISAAAFEAGADTILSLAIALAQTTSRCRELDRLVGGIHSGSAIVGRSPAIRRLLGAISRAADCDATVLVEGPIGSGKSLAARMIHCKSRRANRQLVAIDAPAATADSLAKAIEEARGTTLVIEDVDRLSAPAQAVLVRHLKERSSAQSGGTPRLVATTSAHMPEMVARGSFREDLLYRLHSLPLVVPSLRERIEDIALLARSILENASPQQTKVTTLSPAALASLESMAWPGNVAQLDVVVRRAHALAGGGTIEREHVCAAPVAVAEAATGTTVHERDVEEQVVSEESVLPFEQEEQRMLTRALRATKGNVRRAAQLLGIGRATLYRKIQQYRLRLH